jgi:hypothetical protein
MTTILARGVLGPTPQGVWREGRNRLPYIEIGDQRFDDCIVVDYLISSLENQIGDDIELSFCRFDKKGAFHVCAFKKGNGKIERLPDPSPTLLREMIFTTFVGGVVAFITTWFIAPLLIVIPFFAAKSAAFDPGEKVLAALVVLGFVGIWASQLLWVLFYSNRFSPKVRLRIITAARTALD